MYLVTYIPLNNPVFLSVHPDRHSVEQYFTDIGRQEKTEFEVSWVSLDNESPIGRNPVAIDVELFGQPEIDLAAGQVVEDECVYALIFRI